MNESTAPQHGLASAVRLARSQRIHVLRTRVVAIAVALFVAAWAGLYVQLVSGHDPALASSSSSVATQSADPSVTDASDDGWSGDDSSATPTESSVSSTAAVTTGQS
jgi:cell division protein FtsN